MDVLIADGLIADVRPTAPPPADAEVIEGRGKTLLPGFVNLHGHLTLTAAPPWYLSLPNAEHNAEAHLYAGVTTVLDLGGELEEERHLRRRILLGEIPGPRLYYAGPHLTVPGGYPLNLIRDVYGRLASMSLEGNSSVGVLTTQQLEKQIDRIAAYGGRFIKLMVATVPPSGAPRLSEKMVRAAVKRAHAHGLKVAAHIDTVDDALICARAGCDLLAHGVETSVVTEEQAKEIAASGIAMEPTLVNWERWDELVALDYKGSQLERESEPPEMMAQLSHEVLAAQAEGLRQTSFRSWSDAIEQFKDQRIKNVGVLRKAGVRILIGSDSMGTVATFSGAYHDELAYLVDAGVPAGEVLMAATSVGARFLDANATFGAIDPGMIADVLLVEGDPLQDIRATRNIARVFVRGVAVERLLPKRDRAGRGDQRRSPDPCVPKEPMSGCSCCARQRS
jgi:imidazolonepropionase-like amidohydrolase